MAILKTQLPEIAFPFELDTLVIEADEGDDDSLTVLVEWNGAVLFEDTLFFGSDQRVEVEGVAQMIQDSSLAVMGVLRLKVNGAYVDGGGVNVLPCTVVTDLPASEFVSESFLTLLAGPKQVSPTATEVVAFYSTQPDEEVLADFFFSSSQYGLYRVRQQLSKVVVKDNIHTVVVRFEDMLALRQSDADTLLRVVLVAGRREQEYLVNPYLQHALRFRGAFHVSDVIYFAALERDVKPTRTSGIVGGRQRTFLAEPSTTFKGTTAPLLDSELGWAEDAAHALLLTDEAGREAAVVDNEFKYATDPSELPRLTLSWKYAQHAYKLHRKVHTFDATFDPTYL